MHGPVASAFSKRWPGKPSELLWQISRFHSFIWASGGCYSDFYIHHIDHLCWMKNGWPVKAQGLGGRHYRNSPEGDAWVDQNFDSYAVEYTFEDGSKFYMDGRCNVGALPMYFSHVHGTKGMAVAAKQGDYSGPSSIHKGQLPSRDSMIWQSKVDPSQNDPYVNEWNDLIGAIRNDKPYNEVPFGVQASVVTSMGRMAAHTGQEITYDQMLNHPHEYAPGIDKWTMDSPPPVASDADGKYPVPMPGVKKDREF
jgi:predicted dehydrogenase